MARTVTPLGGGETLGRRLGEELRGRILGGEWRPGKRLPSETELARAYQVSRVTVRTALQALESQGLVTIRHGSGTFVSEFGGGIRAGLQQLRSMTETIRELGHEPGMEWHRVERRPATEGEADRLGVEPGLRVLKMERAVLADREVVAYSYDTILIEDLPPAIVDEISRGSVFAGLERHGIVATRAFAEIHAVRSDEVGWGPMRPRSGLYLLLDQVHFDRKGEPLMHASTYFVEGRFQFVILRTR